MKKKKKTIEYKKNRNITQFEIAEKIRNMIRGKISESDPKFSVLIKIDYSDFYIRIGPYNHITLTGNHEHAGFISDILQEQGYEISGWIEDIRPITEDMWNSLKS